MLDVLRVLKGGKSLADSLATHPEYFSDLYVNMVRAGRPAARWRRSSSGWPSSRRSRDELRGYIISSMIYPALLSLVGLGSILVLLTFVVPRFAAVFERVAHGDPAAHADHAGGQRSACRRTAGWLAAALAARGRRRCTPTSGRPPGGCGGTRLRLRVPLLGDALRKAETARFARAMATLVANGVPLVQSHRHRRRRS